MALLPVEAVLEYYHDSCDMLVPRPWCIYINLLLFTSANSRQTAFATFNSLFKHTLPDTPRVPLLPLRTQAVPSPVRISRPLTHRQRDTASHHLIVFVPSWGHTRRIYTYIRCPAQRKRYSTAVSVYDARLLKPVGNDCESRRPRADRAPEESQAV